MSKLSDLNIKKTIIPGFIFLIFISLGYLKLFDGMELSLYDKFVEILLINSPLELSPRIHPADLNDRAERNLEGKIENREAFINLFEVLAEGDIYGTMDFLFKEKKSPDMDKKMANLVKGLNHLALAVVPVPKSLSDFSGEDLSDYEKEILKKHIWYPEISGKGMIPEIHTFILPNRQLLSSANLIGHIGVESDRDGIHRELQLFYKWEDGIIPTLSLVIALDFLGIDPNNIMIELGKEVTIPMNDGTIIKIPIDSNCSVMIPYPSLWHEGWKRVPLDKVASSINDEDLMYEFIDLWENGIVMAADITTSHKDFGITPFENIYPLSGLHTSILNGILTNNFYKPITQKVRVFIVLFSLTLLLFSYNSKKQKHSIIALYLIIYIAINSFCWFKFLIIPWIITPAISILAVWIYIITEDMLVSQQKKLLLENALSRYFPSALASKVLKERSTNLFPENKELTIMFTDIAGFTKWSSEKSPGLVHDFLSEYLELMASVIFDHGGTIDKFMGDGILAFFGDPYFQENHTERCMNSAISMLQHVKENRDIWKEKYDIDLNIRVGINRGEVIVGNLGTKTRIEYTVIGSAVNLAQRMESNAPLGSILVNENTWKHISHKFTFTDEVSVQAKGYDKGVRAFVYTC